MHIFLFLEACFYLEYRTLTTYLHVFYKNRQKNVFYVLLNGKERILYNSITVDRA